MDARVRDLLQLYENTLAEHGFMRQQSERIAETNERELCHIRWMLDQMLQDAEKEGWSDAKIHRWLGFIQGVLWTNKVFPIPTLEAQTDQLDMLPRAAAG